MADQLFTFNIFNIFDVFDEDYCIPALLLQNNLLLSVLLTQLLPSRRPMLPRIQGYAENIILPTFLTEDYRVHFRLNKECIQALFETLGPKLITDHTGGYEQIPPMKQLLIFLCYMANNETFREIGQYFGVGKSTAHKIIVRILEKFNETFVNIIKWPNAQEQNTLARENQLLHGLPDIIGAVDGTHIRLSSCPGNDSVYINRKGFASMQLQIVVDHNLTILDAYTGWPGCAHDARVLRNSSLYSTAEAGEKFSPNKLILGDSAYPLKNWLVTPFRDNGNLNQTQRRFNKRISSCRQVVERTIGHIKCRFRRLKEIGVHDPKQIACTILAGCILHNICIKSNEDIDMFLDNNNGDDQDGHPNNYVNIFPNDFIGVQRREQLMNFLR